MTDVAQSDAKPDTVEPVAQRLRSYVTSRGGPAKDEQGRAVGTAWPMMLEAANEIERLAEELQYQYACGKAQQEEIKRLSALARSDAEPVAWRALLREARPYVASAKGDDTETHNFVDGLLRDIDAALTQPDAEPVAGSLDEARTIALEQRCERGTPPWDLACVTIANKIGEKCGYPPIPTNTAPPRPDASAGLIEAAEIADEQANRTESSAQYAALTNLAGVIRARAADRSGK